MLIPEDNVKDLTEIPDNIKNRLDIHPVKWIDQVLDFALEHKPDALPVVATSNTPNPETTENEPVATALKH